MLLWPHDSTAVPKACGHWGKTFDLGSKCHQLAWVWKFKLPVFWFKALGFTLNLFLPKGILARLQVSRNNKIMAVHLDSIASNESMRTKPSHLPLLSLDRSVQLFPAHLTRLATFATDAPDLTPSQLMHLFDHGNTHTKDKSQTTGYWWINCSQGPQVQCLS